MKKASANSPANSPADPPDYYIRWNPVRRSWEAMATGCSREQHRRTPDLLWRWFAVHADFEKRLPGMRFERAAWKNTWAMDTVALFYEQTGRYPYDFANIL